MISAIYVAAVKIFMAIMLLFTSLSGGCTEINGIPEELSENADVRIVTFNLRCTGIGETSVAYRAPYLSAEIEALMPDSAGFQEANYRWISYLKDHLTDYAYVGEGRQGGVFGEYSPIFYLKDKYTIRDSGTFWLSKTPEKKGSKDWGSQNVRICTWAVLENKETGECYVHLNTHLDHISTEARENQMKILLNKVGEFIGDYPLVVTGDFNDDCNSATYSLATEVLRDSRLIASETENKATYHDYNENADGEPIDFIFVSDKLTPVKYHVIDDKINGVYLSDHYGIYIDATLN